MKSCEYYIATPVLASRLATVQFRRRWLTQFVVGALLVFTAISSLRIAPHQLAYFNEIVGGPDQGYRYLSDSNLDWGQDLKGVKAYMEKENLPSFICHTSARPAFLLRRSLSVCARYLAFGMAAAC